MKAKASILGAVFLITFKCLADDGSGVDKAVGGSANMTVIAYPDSIDAWRTVASLKQERKMGFQMPELLEKAGKPIPVSKDLAAQLAKLLEDPHTYLKPGTSLKDCIPVPDVVIAFMRGNREVDAYFCFEYNVLVVDQVQSDIDRGRPAILKTVKQIFRNDQEIQSLK
ncbi:MAG TPA: hypothetical protein VNU95_05100 [Candidatus Acidoferrales bacterium]|nr:hypothetical protein [Candidatus Acidoferrales bacterium]